MTHDERIHQEVLISVKCFFYKLSELILFQYDDLSLGKHSSTLKSTLT